MNLESLNISNDTIDKQNVICYDAIADEYGNDSHETCRDFDAGTQCFLKKAIKFDELSELPNEFNYLDVGVGTGVSLEFLLPWLNEKKAIIDILDISSKMLNICKSKFGKRISNFYNISIHKFETHKKYDLIVSSLCDPFLTIETILIIKKLLSKDGVVLITLPTLTWAKKVRTQNINQTVFHDSQRNKYVSYSFCWSKADLIKKFEDAGLYNIYSRVILVDEIQKSKVVGKINKGLIEKEKRVPMLLTLKFINRVS